MSEGKGYRRASLSRNSMNKTYAIAIHFTIRKNKKVPRNKKQLYLHLLIHGAYFYKTKSVYLMLVTKPTTITIVLNGRYSVCERVALISIPERLISKLEVTNFNKYSRINKTP